MKKIACLTCVTALVATAYSYTVYDAGKALRANCASGTPTGASGDTYYTDENGGKWQYRLSSESGAFSSATLTYGEKAYNGMTLVGFAVETNKQASSIRVNITDHAVPVSGGEPVEPDELVLFPANSSAQCAHVRFIAPEDGWYSAFVSAHDIVKELAANTDSGVKVTVRAQGKLLVSQIVSIESFTNAIARTRRFDFQMPVRHLAAGDAIDVIVGGNGNITSDNTGVKFFVTKEDEGRFYDSGIAMTNNLATAYTNVYGTVRDDMVAINANDGSCAASQSAVTDIEIDGVEADYSHSAVRLLSAPDPVERIRIRNVRGHFFQYAIGFTHYFPERPKGTFRDITLENVCVGHAPQPPDMWPMGRSPILFFDKEVRVEGLKVDGFETLLPLAEVPDRWKLKPGIVPHARPY